MRSSKRWFIVLLMVVLAAILLVACGAKATPNEEVAEPSNPGGPGEAVKLTGDPKAGETVYTANCASCHGDQGKGGVANAGSTDGTVPALNPIDASLISADKATDISRIDLFIEHGSAPEAEQGQTPEKQMAAFGDGKTLTSQQIADVIAYILQLNGK